MKLQDRLNTLEVNLDDLQSGIEAVARQAAALRKDAVRIEDRHATEVAVVEAGRALAGRTRELQSCVRDQREALKRLRQNTVSLRAELRTLLKAASTPRRRPAR